MGSANGAYSHGGWTEEAIEMRQRAARLLKALREVRRSC
jgi:hypothetical protein